MEQLIAGLKKKDPEAFKEVMALYKNKIFNYLKVLLKNDEIAEELTQDTFVKVYFKGRSRGARGCRRISPGAFRFRCK